LGFFLFFADRPLCFYFSKPTEFVNPAPNLLITYCAARPANAGALSGQAPQINKMFYFNLIIDVFCAGKYGEGSTLSFCVALGIKKKGESRETPNWMNDFILLCLFKNFFN
jgi:hypothetical protein